MAPNRSKDIGHYSTILANPVMLQHKSVMLHGIAPQQINIKA